MRLSCSLGFWWTEVRTESTSEKEKLSPASPCQTKQGKTQENLKLYHYQASYMKYYGNKFNGITFLLISCSWALLEYTFTNKALVSNWKEKLWFIPASDFHTISWGCNSLPVQLNRFFPGQSSHRPKCQCPTFSPSLIFCFLEGIENMGHSRDFKHNSSVKWNINAKTNSVAGSKHWGFLSYLICYHLQ